MLQKSRLHFVLKSLIVFVQIAGTNLPYGMPPRYIFKLCHVGAEEDSSGLTFGLQLLVSKPIAFQ